MVTGIVTVAPVWFPIITNCVWVMVLTSFGEIVNVVPRTTIALLDTESPMNVGTVALPGNPLLVNNAAARSYKIAV